MRPLRAQVSISELYAKAGREADGIGRVEVVDCPVGVHTHETVGVARKRGTEPPKSGGTRAVVLVLDFAIPGGIIGVLRLFVLLVRVSVGNATENLELREEEKVIRRRCYVARRRAAAVCRIVRVLRHGFQYCTERRRNDCNNRPGIAREARPANVCTHLRAFPPAGVGVARVHNEIARTRGRPSAIRAILIITETHVCTAGECGLCKLKMDPVCALDARIMVKADNESVGRDIRERELSDRAVKRDRLSVADAPIVRALSRVGNGLDNAPLVIVERRAHERERQRVGGRAGNDIDGAARRLPVLCRRDRVRPRLRDGENRRPVARLCGDCRPALFQRDGCAGVYVDGNRRGKERQRHRVAIDDGDVFRVGRLPVERGLDAPCTGLRQGENARAARRRAVYRFRALCRCDRRSARNGYHEGELDSGLADCVCSTNHF